MPSDTNGSGPDNETSQALDAPNQTSDQLKNDVTSTRGDPMLLHAKFEMTKIDLEGVATEQHDEIKKIWKLLEWELNGEERPQEDKGAASGSRGMNSEESKKAMM